MGRVRTKTVKRSARQIVERFYSKLGLDFHDNKKVVDEVTVVPSKRMRNKIAGFVTHLMKRIERGESIKGISLKLQAEELERRLDYVPEESALKVDDIKVDRDTKDMLRKLGYADKIRVSVHEARPFRRGDRFNKRTNKKPAAAAAPKPAAAAAAPAEEQATA